MSPWARRNTGPAAPPPTAPPSPRAFFEALPGLGFIASATEAADQARRHWEQDQRDGTKNEYIPPYVPNGPFRGPNPAQPPLDPRETRPAPYPATPPDRMPDKVENVPTLIDPRDLILITPDQSDEAAKHIFVENRGDETTRSALSVVAKSARNLQKLRPQVSIVHIGGSRNDKEEEVKELYEPNRDPVASDPNGRKGSSLADLTLLVNGTYLHISFYRSKADGSAIPIEIDQARRLAYNSRKPAIVVMIENKRGKQAIDQRALEQYLVTIVDALVAGAGKDHINVRDPRIRDRIIRYFDAYKPR